MLGGYVFEVIIVLILTYLFYKHQKPKVKFLFLGYIFFIVAMIIQIPIRYLEVTLSDVHGLLYLSHLVSGPLLIAISEITKYVSMKNFLKDKTRSFKNGIFFGIGWVSLESISIITVTFFTLILSYFSLNFDMSYLLNPQYGPFNFIFFLIVNLAITVFVIKSIMQKRRNYLLLAIVFSIVVYLGLALISGVPKYLFSLAVFMFSISVITCYKEIK